MIWNGTIRLLPALNNGSEYFAGYNNATNLNCGEF